MNTKDITWLELYNYLYEQANDKENFGLFDWNTPVIVHDALTGEEYTCDTYYISDDRGEDRPVLMINVEELLTEDDNGS